MRSTEDQIQRDVIGAFQELRARATESAATAVALSYTPEHGDATERIQAAGAAALRLARRDTLDLLAWCLVNDVRTVIPRRPIAELRPTEIFQILDEVGGPRFRRIKAS